MSKTKRKRITTPTGQAQWAWLTKPNTKFDPDGVFGVDLLIQKEEAQTLVKFLDQLAEESYQKACNDLKKKGKAGQIKDVIKKVPYEEVFNEEGESLELIKFKFSNNAKTKNGNSITIPLFDAKNQLIKDKDVRVGNGSLIKVNFTPNTYFVAAWKQAGVKLYLNAVQILELADVPTDGGFFGFEAEEDYGFDGESLAEEQVEDNNNSVDEDFDEELDF